jgi:hypothetical protein
MLMKVETRIIDYRIAAQVVICVLMKMAIEVEILLSRERCCNESSPVREM